MVECRALINGRGLGCRSVVECLPGIHRTLGYGDSKLQKTLSKIQEEENKRNKMRNGLMQTTVWRWSLHSLALALVRISLASATWPVALC